MKFKILIIILIFIYMPLSANEAKFITNIKNEPDNPENYIAHIEYKMKRKAYDRVIALCNQYAVYIPFASMTKILFDTYQTKSDLDTAIFNLPIEIHNEDLVHYVLGLLYCEKGWYNQAATYFTDVPDFNLKPLPIKAQQIAVPEYWILNNTSSGSSTNNQHIVLEYRVMPGYRISLNVLPASFGKLPPRHLKRIISRYHKDTSAKKHNDVSPMYSLSLNNPMGNTFSGAITKPTHKEVDQEITAAWFTTTNGKNKTGMLTLVFHPPTRKLTPDKKNCVELIATSGDSDFSTMLTMIESYLNKLYNVTGALPL